MGVPPLQKYQTPCSVHQIPNVTAVIQVPPNFSRSIHPVSAHIAEDFFDAPEGWKSIRPAKTELLKTIHKRVGKEVAHLTYERQKVTPAMKVWRFAEIMKDVTTVVTEFLELVPKQLLGERWDEYKKAGMNETTPCNPPPLSSGEDTGVTNPIG